MLNGFNGQQNKNARISSEIWNSCDEDALKAKENGKERKQI